MILEGDKSVIDAIKEKKRLMDAGEEHGHIRPLLILGGGVIRGVYGAGAVTAIQETGFGEVFDYIVGISTGAPAAAYLMSGNPRQGATIYSEECCTSNFIRPLWFRNYFTHLRAMFKDPIDVDYMDYVWRGGTGKPFDCEKIFQHRSKLYIAVTFFETSTAWYINTCECEELRMAVNGSCAMPGLSTDKYFHQNHQIVDGAVGNPFPLDLIETLEDKPTHILFNANSVKHTGRSTFVRIFESFLFKRLLSKRMSSEILSKILNRFKNFEDLFDTFNAKYGSRSAIVWTDGKVKALDTNSKKVKDAAYASEMWWRDLLTK